MSGRIDPPWLLATGLTVIKGGKTILSELDLHVDRGELVALLGPNGAGKSTLVHALTGLEPLAAGVVRTHGRVAAGLQIPALARRSVSANVTTALSWWGVERAARSRRANKALRAMGVDRLASRCATELSGGEARRVHLARLAAVDPDVLLLDEPFAGLDAPTRGDLLYDLAGEIRSPDRATLVVVHDRAEAWALADRVLVMIDGRIAATGKPNEVFESPLSREVAEFVGFTGKLELGEEILYLRPSDVEIGGGGSITAQVTRKVPVEDGVRVELKSDRGMVVANADLPGPTLGDQVRIRSIGGVRFPKRDHFSRIEGEQ